MKYTVLLYLLEFLPLCAGTNAREIDVTCEPHTVWFDDGKTLHVNVKIKNIPNGQTLFQNVFLYGSTGKEGAIHNVKVGDYIGNEYTFGIKQYVGGSWNNKAVRVCLMSEQDKDCDLLDQDFIILKHLKHAKNVQAGYSPDPDCTMGGCLLTYDWTREHCKNRNRPSTQVSRKGSTFKKNIAAFMDEFLNFERSFSFFHDQNSISEDDEIHVHNNINMNQSEESSVELPKEKRKKRSTDTESEIHRNVINNEEFYKKVDLFNRSYYDNYHNLRVGYIEPDIPKIALSYTHQKWEDHYYVHISCYSRMNKFDLLYLYQQPKEPGDSPLLLHMKQYLEKITGQQDLRFNKKIQNDDQWLKVFCVRASIDNSTYKISKKEYIYEYEEEKKIFHDLEPSVIHVSPPVARFAPGETLSLVCSGTPTHEGRELTWYIQDSNTSAIELPGSDSQKYDPKTYQNILTLHMNETLLTKKLFCAEDFHIQIKYPESNFTLKRYGIRNESAVILKLREEEAKVPVQRLIWGLAGGGAVLLLAIFFILRARSRRRGAPADSGHEGNEEGYYSTAQVKYVVLDLPQAQSGKPEQRADPSPYAKIVGVYNPGN